MPKQKMEFFTKLKFIMFWLFKYTRGTMTLVTCSECNSKRVTFKNSEYKDGVYKSEYTCKDCGATGKCTEVWTKL